VQIKEAKIRFNAGNYKGVQVIEALFDGGYNILLTGKKESDSTLIGAQRSGDTPRLFKSIDAAVKNAREIGFLKIEVVFSASSNVKR
jgi:hypothetical protein